MLQTISSFFDKHLKPDEENSSTEAEVDKLHLASAALLIELCKTDQSIETEETEAITRILGEKFELSDAMLEELYGLAEEEAHQATSLYQFTSLINEYYDHESKIALIRDMWEVAFADGNLDKYEEHLIRKIAELLYVSHSDFIKTKLEVKNLILG